MASTYLQRTTSSLGSATTSTLSVWVKRNKLSAEQKILFWGTGSTNFNLEFKSDDKLVTNSYNGGSQDMLYKTTRVFRDTSAWYHIVLKIDTTQATASDRIKLYVNGVQETVFDSSTVPSQNETLEINYFNNSQPYIGQNGSGSHFFDGSMSHFHWIDGTAYDASAFGETDANGVWKPKASPSVTYGTNGFLILKDSASVTDQSGNGNNFTVGGGTLTDTLDCPANVFATLNPLVLLNDNLVLSGGNLTASKASGSATASYFSTLGASSGKYYWEAKCIATGASDGWIGIGQDRTLRTNNGDYPGDNTYAVAVGHTGNLRYSGSNVGSYTASSWTAGDIISVALDLDNNYVYFAKNGTWMNSGVPTSGATGTGGYTNATIFDGSLILSVNSLYQSGGDYDWNFGNGYFGTTAVASAGTNASGIGIFEYDVPTGYTALSTKGLNS